MDTKELIAMLTEGLDEEQTKIVTKQIKAQAAKLEPTLKQAKEAEMLAAREAELKLKLSGDGTNENPGAVAYEDWYKKNFAAIQKLQADQAKYVEKYGALDAPNPNPAPPVPAGTQFTKEDIAREVDARIREGYAPRWSDLLTNTGTIVQKHMYAKRTTPIDFKAVSSLAEKFGGDLERAYDEWDRPEREKQAKADQEALIERRVTEELQKRGSHANFPGGADASPGILSRDRDTSKFDRAAMERDLVNTFISGKDEPLSGFGVN